MKPEIIVRIKHEKDDSYPIFIGKEFFPLLSQELRRSALAYSYVIITDSNVARLYGQSLMQTLKEKNSRVFLLSFPAGERSKNLRVWQRIIEQMLALGLGRDSCVLALGGGVVGDLAGFVSASYLRGIPWIQVPTTLLAMVDASVGGKVGIDLAVGKNLLGAFYQPCSVWIDLSCLQTLPKEHLLNGMAEVVKAGLISDAKLFCFLEQKGKDCLRLKSEILKRVIKSSLRVKVKVIEADERESLGYRKILNYGHTIGHCLEALSGYKILHGVAVSLGMRVSASIARKMGFLKENDEIRQNQLLDVLGFPRKVPARLSQILKTPQGKFRFWEYLYQDKKIRAGKVEMVLLDGIGSVKQTKESWTVPVSEDLIESGMKEILE